MKRRKSFSKKKHEAVLENRKIRRKYDSGP